MTGILNILAASISSAIADGYFNRVTLLLPGNGTNGAQNNTFLDSSSNNFSITRNGNTAQGTFSPFSQTGWSNYFNGATTSGPLLYASYSTTNFDWFTAGQDFTLECWVYPVDLATFSYVDGTNTVPRMTGNNDQNGTSNYWTFGPISDGKVRLHYYNGAVVQVTSTATVTANTWNHIAFTKTSSGITIFVNGTASTTTAISGTPRSSATYPLTIGRGNSGSINGYVSNYRILKNVTPPYSGSYTVPTAPLVDISGTKILTAQANRFVDSSSVANTMTVTGSTISVQAFSPFAPTAAYSAATNGGSGYFDGSGDYLATPSTPAFNFGTGAFTIECWIYQTALSGQTPWFFAAGSNGVGFGFQNTSNWGFVQTGVVWALTSTTLPKLNAWNHVVVCRASTTTNQASLFLNGVRVANGTISQTISYTGAYYCGYDGSQIYTGYISGLRATNTDVYGYNNSTITVPTAPFTAISGTQLLLNFTNAGITDATGKNVLETVGNAQISTTQSKFGGSSMYFDGTGDWLQLPNSQFYNFGTGDFTIECWLYPTASGVGTIIAKRSGSNTAWLQLYYDSTNKIGVVVSFNGTTWGINSLGSTTVSLNTWTHVALVRNGSSFKTYINGTADISATDTGSINFPSDAVTIGAGATSGIQTLTGYIDDLRITRYARYTGNFTPPTAAFPLQ